ncbi:orotate phosphoribosyltransferase [Dehalogenimonas etheniformans]|uniref:Orotate phosphoribosyltransferase n=1 Tax=Dehalogenimonas etheniformans TaxID=1536648 RepID=A0A2P5P9Q8_9CHLR|nr:orotate phosphoribosyltransferase [Dehalogenimonas etheniformans]PPD59043.1 orotate phosphoribosyltransferase [Dehalogenimonas etheniformans]QNT77164.1 orotate phosphoribosyltransferase [Dehalogenimonas etheniformans]
MNDIEALFIKSGAVLNGHFVLTSGLHSPVYWEKFRIIENPATAVSLCNMIAEHFKGKGIELVVGPTTGGIILAFEVARLMGLPAAFAEKVPSGEREFRRGFKIRAGEKILVVDDVLTTGKSVREVFDAVAKHKGDIVGVGVLVDRSDTPFGFGAPLFSCLRVANIPAYKPEHCPLCQSGQPLTKPGSS